MKCGETTTAVKPNRIKRDPLSSAVLPESYTTFDRDAAKITIRFLFPNAPGNMTLRVLKSFATADRNANETFIANKTEYETTRRIIIL